MLIRPDNVYLSDKKPSWVFYLDRAAWDASEKPKLSSSRYSNFGNNIHLVITSSQAIACSDCESFACAHVDSLFTDEQANRDILQYWWRQPSTALSDQILLVRVEDNCYAPVVFEDIEGSDGMLEVKTNSYGPANTETITTLGIINPQDEGLNVAVDMVVESLNGWTASFTMCTSTMHYKSSVKKTVGLKDKVCFIYEKMCYECASRANAALLEADIPSKDPGFSTLQPAPGNVNQGKEVPLSEFDSPADKAIFDQFRKAEGF